MTTMAVGDVNATTRGSGARYNDGKAPLELIPAWLLAELGSNAFSDEPSAITIVRWLGEWQAGRMSALDILRNLHPGDAYECARVFGYGAKKYAAWNWIRGMQWSVPLGCALRHAFAEIGGEDIDSESGFTHRGHLVCNLVMLAQFERTFPEGDDRPVEWLNPSGVEVVRTGGSDSLVGFDAALAAEMSRRRKRGSSDSASMREWLSRAQSAGPSTDTSRTRAP